MASPFGENLVLLVDRENRRGGDFSAVAMFGESASDYLIHEQSIYVFSFWVVFGGMPGLGCSILLQLLLDEEAHRIVAESILPLAYTNVLQFLCN